MISHLRTAVLVLSLALTGCGSDDVTEELVTRATVAFVMVGQSTDLGYNQAVHDGSLEVARRFPDVEIIRVEDVPETDEAARVMRQLVEQEGADLVFATSYGHLPYAFEVAAEHPDVIFVHQGGTEPSPGLPNLGTYFGSHWEAMFEAGIAAGHATTSGRLGFIAAFPIPATRANANAFTLGARRVRPDVVTEIRFTQDWCAPDLQAEAVDELLALGVDALAFHQDCTPTILQRTEEAGVGVVGYHADGSEVARTGWLAGAVWTWGGLYADIVGTVLDGDFATSPYNGDFRGSLADGNNPFTLTQPGPSVGQAARAAMAAAADELRAGLTPFTGPMEDRDGVLRIEAGQSLSVVEVDRMDWWVAGVVGEEPTA